MLSIHNDFQIWNWLNLMFVANKLLQNKWNKIHSSETGWTKWGAICFSNSAFMPSTHTQIQPILASSTVVRRALPAVAIQQKEMLLNVAFPRNGFPSWKAKNKENSFHSSNDFLFMPLSHDLFHLSAPQRTWRSIRASEKSANFEVFCWKVQFCGLKCSYYRRTSGKFVTF